MTQTQTANDSFGVKKRYEDLEPLPIDRVEYRITVDRRTSIPGYPLRFSPGEHTVIIYKDQEKAFLDKVEDRHDLVKLAHEQYEADLANHLVSSDDNRYSTVEEALADIRSSDRKRRELEMQYKFPGNVSPESKFEDMTRGMGRAGIRPISKAEKVRDLEPPEVREAKFVRSTVQGLTDALGKTNGASNGVEELKELVNRQAQQIDSLKNQVSELRKSKQHKG